VKEENLAFLENTLLRICFSNPLGSTILNPRPCGNHRTNEEFALSLIIDISYGTMKGISEHEKESNKPDTITAPMRRTLVGNLCEVSLLSSSSLSLSIAAFGLMLDVDDVLGGSVASRRVLPSRQMMGSTGRPSAGFTIWLDELSFMFSMVYSFTPQSRECRKVNFGLWALLQENRWSRQSSVFLCQLPTRRVASGESPPSTTHNTQTGSKRPVLVASSTVLGASF
jgi:hypothetical protein